MTENFSLAELTVTSTGLNNEPPVEIAGNLVRIAETLEQVRALLGNNPIHVNSAYRSPEVNKAVKGSATSAHLKGLAADFVHSKLSIETAFDQIMHSGIEFDQLILEPTWVHIGLADNGKTPRRQCLVAKPGGGRMRYEVARG